MRVFFLFLFIIFSACHTIETVAERPDYTHVALLLPKPPNLPGLEHPELMDSGDIEKLALFSIEYEAFLEELKSIKEHFLQ